MLADLAIRPRCATTVVVLASANDFLLDAVGGLAAAGLGMLATGRLGQ